MEAADPHFTDSQWGKNIMYMGSLATARIIASSQSLVQYDSWEEGYRRGLIQLCILIISMLGNKAFMACLNHPPVFKSSTVGQISARVPYNRTRADITSPANNNPQWVLGSQVMSGH